MFTELFTEGVQPLEFDLNHFNKKDIFKTIKYINYTSKIKGNILILTFPSNKDFMAAEYALRPLEDDFIKSGNTSSIPAGIIKSGRTKQPSRPGRKLKNYIEE